MILNQATDYGIRIVLFLARQEGTRTEAREISRNEVIPERFLFKIMRSLVKAGIVKSYRGINGGFTLNRKPNEIALLNVVEAVEGPVVINCCLRNADECNKNAASYCIVHQELGQLRQDITTRLGKVTFHDLLAREKEQQGR
jgi:Rrf2 family protein